MSRNFKNLSMIIQNIDTSSNLRYSQNLYNFHLRLSPSNRVQIALKPFIESHKQKSKPAITRVYASPLPKNKDGEIIYSKRTLASRPNCKIQKIPDLPRPKAFTRHARQTLLDAGGALDKAGYHPGDFWFFTGTLSGSTPAAMEMMARYSRWLVNNLKQYLRDKYKIYLTFNTWEWQKRGALHLHLVICCPDYQTGCLLESDLKEKWLDYMDEISQQSGVNMYERYNGESWDRLSQPVQDNVCKTIRCEKSVAAYLSKYVGKSSASKQAKLQKASQAGKFCIYYPSSWWSISNELRSIIKQWTFGWVVRLPLHNAIADIYTDVTQLLDEISTLRLPLFSPDGFPSYFYQNFYIEPSKYADMPEIFADMIDQIQCRHGATNLQSALCPMDAVDWLNLPKNYDLCQRFILMYPQFAYDLHEANYNQDLIFTAQSFISNNTCTL